MNSKKSRRLCLNCQKECKRHVDFYCNTQCQQDLRQKKLIQSNKASTRTFRSYLLKINGNKCQICGLVEWNNKPIPLVTDHIDGNSENKTLENIRLICCNCDALLPTYKGRNKGKGRYNRRLRYLQEKSY